MRTSGILLHISSLPSKYGIGTLGREARRFVNFLEQAGQTYWQILPVCPTSYGDSPYQSFSSFAGNPYFIDLEMLCADGYLTEEECDGFCWGQKDTEADFGILYENRYALLRKAYARFLADVPKGFGIFCEKEKDWLADYALFMALKEANGGKPWFAWDKGQKFRKPEAVKAAKEAYSGEIRFHQMLQYLFYKQWKRLKAYAAKKGISIIGDVPIYVAYDSADVWAAPGQFYLDEQLNPIEVAGCPPDAFAKDGQLWGNPLFRWDVMKEDGYAWWTKRVAAMAKLYDVIRIDHFRGFDSYYAIPAQDKTARNGEWKTGPGMDLFYVLSKKLGKLPIIVEDLGFLTPSVIQMVKDSGFPGMKVLQFAFDPDAASDYLPHHYEKNSVVYTGTHDNDTSLGWMQSAPKEYVKFARQYLRLSLREGYHWGMMRGAWASVSDLAIVPMQDILGLGLSARMNTPSTLGGNWKWRMKKGDVTLRLAQKVRKYMKVYGRDRRQGSGEDVAKEKQDSKAEEA